MEFFTAFLICLTVQATHEAQLKCRKFTNCSCGNTQKNVSVCISDDSVHTDVCSRFSRCERCEEGSNNCSKCQEGFEGPLCNREIMKIRQKRQFALPYRGNFRRRLESEPKRGSKSCDPLDASNVGSINCVKISSEEEEICTGKCWPDHHFQLLDSQDEMNLTCGNGVWTPLEAFPKCIRKPVTEMVYCEDPGNIENSIRRDNTSSSSRRFPQGSRVDYDCIQGYELQGERSLFCFPSGKWSSSPPTCVAESTTTERDLILCRDPGDSENSVRWPITSPYIESFPPSSQLLYECVQGYEMRGQSSLLCLPSGDWSASPPKCVAKPTVIEPEEEGNQRRGEIKYCKDPGNVEYSIRQDNTLSNSQRFPQGCRVDYDCIQGYELQGERSLFCLLSGQWSSSPPTCVEKSTTTERDLILCRDPGHSANSVRRPISSPYLESFPPGSQVVYDCDQGYQMTGPSTLFCFISGNWSARRPRCVSNTTVIKRQEATKSSVKYCVDPGIPPNSFRRPSTLPTCQGFIQGSQLQYTCDQDYKLTGEQNLLCLASEKWTASVPTCTKQYTDAEIGKIRQKRQFPIPFLRPFRPELDSEPKGDVKSCDPLDASNLESINCVQLSVWEIEICTGKCSPDHHFQLLDSDEMNLTCGNGVWTPLASFPKCIRKPVKETVYCEDPGNIEYGIRQDNTSSNSRRFPQGSRVYYTCVQGYELQGARSLFCFPSGKWSSSPPTCVVESTTAAPGRDLVLCRDPGHGANTFRWLETPPYRGGFPPGSQLVYGCVQGYEMRGQSSLFCLLSGNWSASRPRCVAKPTVIEPEVIEEGNRRRGEMKYCKDLGNIEHSIRQDNTLSNNRRFPQGSRVDYACVQGYELQGERSLFCLLTGQWSSSPPTCAEESTPTGRDLILCRDPGHSANSVRRPITSPYSESFPPGSQVVYDCDQGYQMTGQSSLFCFTSGSWSARRPRCVSNPTVIKRQETIESSLKYCADPGISPNSFRRAFTLPTCRGFIQGNQLQYICDQDFKLTGEQNLFCLASGKWTASLPTCTKHTDAGKTVTEMVYCEDPGNIEHSIRQDNTSSSSRRFPQGSRVDYDCVQGYELQGERSLFCFPSGKWSSSPPTCVVESTTTASLGYPQEE